MFNNYN